MYVTYWKDILRAQNECKMCTLVYKLTVKHRAAQA
jgi:hypothetical protein